MNNMENLINSPKHYKHKSGYDAITWIERFGLDFSSGNCCKYLFRRGLKDGNSCSQDEAKAIWYFKHSTEQQFKKLVMSLGIKSKENYNNLWETSKNCIFARIIPVFGKPGLNQDGTENWNIGGCDLPKAIDFIREKCLTIPLECSEPL